MSSAFFKPNLGIASNGFRNDLPDARHLQLQGFVRTEHEPRVAEAFLQRFLSREEIPRARPLEPGAEGLHEVDHVIGKSLEKKRGHGATA